ncbi:uncharacterized protein LOC110252663 [Exaiptasia diaphana]|uniref:MARVEL domain-containing protein n=1 Tax=Exaiptasia diaphana TaxID=2652724 RepID=A0A913Y4W0_EXADI|nr:uncharacterized protein LOC110252663 [Exaiptasia diaphana]
MATREVVEKRVERTVETTAKKEIHRQVESRVYRVYCGCCDLLWPVTTIEGWFKLLEFITSFLCFVILSSYHESGRPYFEFLIFVGTTAWIFVILHIFLKVTHIYEKLPYVLIQPLVEFVLLGVGIFSFLLASSVAFGYAFNRDVIIAAAAFGYITMVLFAVELVWKFLRYRRNPPEREAPRTENVRADEFAY